MIKEKNSKGNAASHSVSKNEFKGEKEKNKTMRGKMNEDEEKKSNFPASRRGKE
jgi:hypothetical protein